MLCCYIRICIVCIYGAIAEVNIKQNIYIIIILENDNESTAVSF